MNLEKTTKKELAVILDEKDAKIAELEQSVIVPFGKASDDILAFAKKHKRVIEKSKLSESFEALHIRLRYTENLER